MADETGSFDMFGKFLLTSLSDVICTGKLGLIMVF